MLLLLYSKIEYPSFNNQISSPDLFLALEMRKRFQTALEMKQALQKTSLALTAPVKRVKKSFMPNREAYPAPVMEKDLLRECVGDDARVTRDCGDPFSGSSLDQAEAEVLRPGCCKASVPRGKRYAQARVRVPASHHDTDRRGQHPAPAPVQKAVAVVHYRSSGDRSGARACRADKIGKSLSFLVRRLLWTLFVFPLVIFIRL